MSRISSLFGRTFAARSGALVPVFLALPALVSALVPPSIPFVRLHTGVQSGFTRNSEIVIRDADEFTRRWRGVQQGSPEAVLPEVDFEKTTVVLVATGTRNTEGHSVRVDSVAPLSTGVTVYYTVTSPGRRCMSLQVLTSPIEVVSFARVAGEVKFKKSEASGPC